MRALACLIFAVCCFAAAAIALGDWPGDDGRRSPPSPPPSPPEGFGDQRPPALLRPRLEPEVRAALEAREAA